jgi:hypothetical protein
MLPRLAAALLLCASAVAQAEPPQTVPESSGHTATSRVADVEKFLAACQKLPHGDLLAIRTIGTTAAGHPQILVKIAARVATATPADAPAIGRLRALVIANIHAGEVEGKEAVQQLVREFALGQHAELLARCELWFLPIYNVDGNEAVGPKNRAGQNGPDLVGQRANGKGLDLNRDFVKADASETRWLLGLFREIDPHLFMDLHTTNGSEHGYHLTYAPSLSPNVDRGIARLSRQLLDEVTAAMQKDHGFQTFDYGNFETKDWEGNGAPESATGVRGWYSYDHRARYGINYFGLRNRIGILSEAYSYADFATRIAATRAFVLTTLQRLVANEAELLRVTATADARPRADGDGAWFWFDTAFAPPETLPVLVGEVERTTGGDGRLERAIRKGDGKPETMPVARAFRGRKSRALPDAWAVRAPSAEVVQALQWHGVEFTTVAAPQSVRACQFAVTAKKKPKRPYQGHQELVLAGQWSAPTNLQLPAGTLLVPATQRFALLAATLLEPESEDSLSTWNFFEATTGDHYPVLRVVGS